MRVEVTSAVNNTKQMRLTTHLATEAYSLGQMHALLVANDIGCGSHVDVTGQQTLVIWLDQIKKIQNPRKQRIVKNK